MNKICCKLTLKQTMIVGSPISLTPSGAPIFCCETRYNKLYMFSENIYLSNCINILHVEKASAYPISMFLFNLLQNFPCKDFDTNCYLTCTKKTNSVEQKTRNSRKRVSVRKFQNYTIYLPFKIIKRIFFQTFKHKNQKKKNRT